MRGKGKYNQYSDAGYREVDLQMAAEVDNNIGYLVLIVLMVVAQVEELDLVVGGHSHTFLYSGPPPRSQCSTPQCKVS